MEKKNHSAGRRQNCGGCRDSEQDGGRSGITAGTETPAEFRRRVLAPAGARYGTHWLRVHDGRLVLIPVNARNLEILRAALARRSATANHEEDGL